MAVRESKERVRTAILNTGFSFPQRRITVNLALANRKKAGTAFDLPIALGILCAMNQWDNDALEELLLVGELSLDGLVRPIRGVLSLAMMAKQEGLRGVVVPEPNAQEAAVVDEFNVHHVASLLGCQTIGEWGGNRDSTLTLAATRRIFFCTDRLVLNHGGRIPGDKEARGTSHGRMEEDELCSVRTELRTGGGDRGEPHRQGAGGQGEPEK